MSLKETEVPDGVPNPDQRVPSKPEKVGEHSISLPTSTVKDKSISSYSKFPIFWLDGFANNTVIQAVVLCNWDNIYGPKVRNMWVIDDIPVKKNSLFENNETNKNVSKDRCLDWETLSFIARQMLCSEIMKDPCDSFLENKLYDSPIKRLALAAIVFGAMSQTDMSIHSLCIVPCYDRLNDFLRWKDVCFEWLTNCVLQLRITLATNATAGFTIIKKNLKRLVHIMENEEQACNFKIEDTFIKYLKRSQYADKPTTTTTSTTHLSKASHHLSTQVTSQFSSTTTTKDVDHSKNNFQQIDVLSVRTTSLTSATTSPVTTATLPTTTTLPTATSSTKTTQPSTTSMTTKSPQTSTTTSDVDFFHNCLVAHLAQCHRSVVMGTNVAHVNELIQALTLFTLPHNAHKCKLLRLEHPLDRHLKPSILNDDDNRQYTDENNVDDVNNGEIYNAFVNKQKCHEHISSYAPELHVQGLLKTEKYMRSFLDEVMFGTRPTALIDVDTREVMLMCWTEQYDDMRHKFITNNLHQLWNECPADQFHIRDLFKSVKVTKSLVSPFLNELSTLPCHLVRPRVNNFMKQLYRRSLVFVQYVESRRQLPPSTNSSSTNLKSRLASLTKPPSTTITSSSSSSSSSTHPTTSTTNNKSGGGGGGGMVSLVTLREQLGLNLDWDYHVVSSFAEVIQQGVLQCVG